MLARSIAFAAAVALTATAASPSPARPDPRILAMVRAVSASHLRAIDERLVGFRTRNDFSEIHSTKTQGVFAARDWIVAQFRKIAATTGGRMTVRLDTYVQPKLKYTPRAVTESSVIATLRGSEPGRIYVMSSHYDDCNGNCTDGLGVAPGADDNGSGTSAVLEAARVMAATHFRGTIIFACFDGEELGLWGSNHFAKEMAAKHAPILADLNNDIVGNSKTHTGRSVFHTLRIFSEALPLGAKRKLVNLLGTENDSPSRELARFIVSTDKIYLPHLHIQEIFRADRFLRGGDQESFQGVGYPAIRFTEASEVFEHQHQNVRVQNGIQYGDLPQYIDPQYLAQSTRANVAALATLALGPAAPTHVHIVLAHLGYTTTLRWRRSADAVGYEVLWRKTDAATWQHVRAVGNVTTVTLPISYDDDLFAVRSVDAKGLRSVGVFPTPVRK